MTTEIVIPWRGGDPHRERALEWLLARLTWPVRLAEAPEGVWNKGKALWGAVNSSDADLIVMHDADVWVDNLDETIRVVEAGQAWAAPHARTLRLTESATAKVLAGAGFDGAELLENDRAEWGGGIVVVPREAYLSCPIDPRFKGFSPEDMSWANALWFLVGEAWRGQAELHHLWHPPQERLARDRSIHPETHLLATRYRQARFKPLEMRALVNEGIELLEGGVDVASAAA